MCLNSFLFNFYSFSFYVRFPSNFRRVTRISPINYFSIHGISHVSANLRFDNKKEFSFLIFNLCSFFARKCNITFCNANACLSDCNPVYARRYDTREKTSLLVLRVRLSTHVCHRHTWKIPAIMCITAFRLHRE